MQNILIKNRTLEFVWQGLLALYCVSVFVSKSGLSIFGLLLILISIFILPWRELYQDRKELLAFVGLYPLAILLSFFSLGGAESAVKVAYSWPWPLLALPAYVVFARKKDHKVALVASLVGLVIACGMSLVIFFRDFGGHFSGAVRVASFWDISRWGLFLASALMGLLGLTLHFKERGQKKEALLIQALAILVVVSLVLSNTRAPWLAAVAGVACFSTLFPRMLKFSSILAVVVVLVFGFNEDLRRRVVSMISVQRTADGHITSKDPSNEGRLHMWKVGSEFFLQQPWFGTGFKNTEKGLNAFIDSKPGYRERYVTSEFSFTDQHSSYLSMLVQMGALFSAIFFALLGWLMMKLAKCWYRERSIWAGAVISLMFVHGAIFVFYTSVVSYEMVALFPFVALWPRKASAP